MNGLLALIILLAAPAADAQDGTWTSARVRSLSSSEMTRQLLGDLGVNFYPNDRLNGERYGRLSMLFFLSVPRAAYESGFCEMDSVSVSFEPVAPARAYDDVPVRPHQVRAGLEHFIRDEARALAPRGRTADEQAAFEKECAAIDPRERRSISGEGTDVLVALRLLSELGDAARAGAALPPLDCRDLDRGGRPPLDPAQCRAELAAILPGELEWAREPREEVGTITRFIHTEDRWVEIMFLATDTDRSYGAAYRLRGLSAQRVRIGRPPDMPPIF